MHKRAEQNLGWWGRPGEALEVAEAYLYLMKSGFSTGEVIVVDGWHFGRLTARRRRIR